MSDADSKEAQSVGKDASSAIEQVLTVADELVANSNLDGALALLLALEQDYIHGVRLFDLLGDIFLKRGETQVGVRYKVLHEVLRGTFMIAMEETVRNLESSNQEDAQRPSVREFTLKSHGPGESPAYKEFMPATAAMGHELMRQGHYDQALQIFTVLLSKNPQDSGLKRAKDQAKKRLNEKRIVTVLQGWLGNLDKIKSDRPTGA
jgi:tetratricopeptide (TPR) repeat protein